MAVVPTLPAITTGIITTSMQSQIVQATSFALNPPTAQLRQSVIQSIPNAAWTPLLFDLEDVDIDPSGAGGHSTSVNTSRFTVVYPGYYLLAGAYATAQNATGQRATKWTVNGSDLPGSGIFMPAISASGDVIPARTMVTPTALNVGDYIELNAWQNSTAALNTDVGVAYIQSSMTVVFKHA